MKTIEELKGMTTEDLVRYAQQLQEEIISKEKENKIWVDQYCSLNRRFENFRNAVKSVALLID